MTEQDRGVISILGYMKVEGKTLSGGDYIEAFPKDDERNPVRIENATNVVIHECKGNAVKKKFSTFVRPEYGRMDSFIEHLTGITKENVCTAKSFTEAIAAFLRWLPDDEVRCVSWSDSDKYQIMHEMEAKDIEDDRLTEFLETWIDCQRLFDKKMEAVCQYKLEEALIASDICTEGKAHDGLVDAYNTALLFAKLKKDPDYELNDIYSNARNGKVEHLGVTLGDIFMGLQLQIAAS